MRATLIALVAVVAVASLALAAAETAPVTAPKDVPLSPFAGKMTEEQALAASKKKFGELETWLSDAGVTFDHTYIKHYNSEWRGVNARHEIPTGTVIASLPDAYTITDDKARNSTIGKALVAAGCSPYSSHSWMASFLLQELHDPQSHFKKFLECMPRLLDNLPMNFRTEELEWLRGSHVLPAVVEQAEELKLEYENLCSCYPAYSKFSREEFNWASNLVLTRVFGITIEPGRDNILMAPMADMFNHRYLVTETEWDYNYTAHAFTITTLEPIAKDQEIYLTYGSKCNTRFFVNYGFALDHNEDNTVVVTVRVPYSDPMYWMKARVLDNDVAAADNANLALRRFQVPIQYGDADVKRLISFARFAAADNDAFKLWSAEESFDLNALLAECELGYCGDGETQEQKDKDRIPPVSVSNEIGALRVMYNAFGDVLRGFPQTIEQDNALLASDADGTSPLAFNHKMAILTRRGEKMVAQFWRNFATAMIGLLRTPWKQLRPQIDEYIAKYDMYSAYVERVVMRLVQLNEVALLDRYQQNVETTCPVNGKTGWPLVSSMVGVCPPFIERNEIETYEYFWRNSDNSTTPISETEYDHDEPEPEDEPADEADAEESQ